MVLAVGLDDFQPFAELGQERFLTVADRIGVLRFENRPPAQVQMVPAELVAQMQGGDSDNNGAVVPALGKLPQGVLLGFGKRYLIAVAFFLEKILDDVIALDNDPQAFQIISGDGRRQLALAHHADVMIGRIGLGEVEFQVALVRIKHPLDNVDFPVLQPFDNLRPGPEPELDVKIKFTGNGAGEVRGKARGVAVFIKKFKGRIIMVAADHDAPVQGELQGGEPLGVEMAVGAVRHDDGKPFVQ